MKPQPLLEPEDWARLEWLASQLGTTSREVMSLGLAWWVRHLHAMVTVGEFGVPELRRLQRMFPPTALALRGLNHWKGVTPFTFDQLAIRYYGRPDLYEAARQDLAEALHMPPETIPTWAISRALWGSELGSEKP